MAKTSTHGPDQSPSRWIINFFDWPLDRDSAPKDYSGPVAADYPDCLAIVEEKVRPERMSNNRKVYRDRWWHYAEKRPDLYAAVERLDRVLICSRVSSHHFFYFAETGCVFADRLVVITLNDWKTFCCISGSLHDVWAHRPGATTHETRNTYFHEQAFEPFPFPIGSKQFESVGLLLFDVRNTIMLTRQEGLTKTYNRFHNPDESAADIQKLRDLHVEMDRAVADAYGWSDLDLGHGFHETKQGTRYTISEPARREVLARLLKLNHERYAEEVRQGLHDKKSKSKSPGRSKRGKTAAQDLPFGDPDDPTVIVDEA